MKKLFFALASSYLLGGMLIMTGCSKSDDPAHITARTHTVTVNWFKDANTPAPTAFIDFYNGAAYTEANATAHANTIDAFCYDHNVPPVFYQQVDFVNM